MAANTALRVTELDFDSIKNNLKTFLRSQSQFQDFDFEGSGMNVLLDVLAYNTHYNAYYLNMIANEMFLDTSKLRESTVSHAKLINYIPESSHGAEAKVNIRITPDEEENPQDQNYVTQLTLNKYSRFFGASVDGINYPFVAINANTVNMVDGTFLFSNVILKQGEVVTRQFLMSPSNTKRRFELGSANIDTSTLVVTVQQSSSNTDFAPYRLVEDVTEINKDSKVYFLEENENGNYSIYFGDNVLGKAITDGNIVTCTYLDTVGSIANRINAFSIIDAPLGFDNNVSITTAGPSYSGSEKETIDQIRYRAPYYYTAQNRAVTVDDYETLIVKDYPNIDSVAIWGGEENDPPVYGKVYLSLKTKDNFFLSNLEKENIKDSLITNRNVLTVFPEIVDPIYKYILVRGRINFNSTITSLQSEQVKAFVTSAIEDYSDENLNRFDSVFQKAKMQNYIESSESSITSSDIDILLQKRIEITLNQSKNYVLDFGAPIRKNDFKNAISSYPALTVKDTNSQERKVFFEEVLSSSSGIDLIEIVNGGINYTVPPSVIITGDGTGATAIARVAGGKVYQIVITNKGSNYTRAFVRLQGGDGVGAIVKPILETRTALLRTYYLKDNGEKVFVNNSAGKVDYDSGIITLNSLNPISVVKNDFYDTNILTINAPMDTEIISSVRNDIVIIDSNDPLSIQIEVVPE